MDKENLSLPPQLVSDRLGNQRVIEFGDVGDNRFAKFGRRRDNTDIAHPHQGQMQGPRYRCCRQRQHIHRAFQPFQLLLVLDAEPLLFIEYQKPQIVECDVLLQQPVRADHDIDFARLEILDDGPLLTAGSETTQTCHIDRIFLEPAAEGCVMLFGENGGRNQHGGLFAVIDRQKGGPQCDLGFAVAHIAAYQAVHGGRFLHVVDHVPDGFELIRGLFIGKSRLEFLDIAVGR